MNAIRKACKGIGPALLVVAIVAIIGAMFWADLGEPTPTPTTLITAELDNARQNEYESMADALKDQCDTLNYAHGEWTMSVAHVPYTIATSSTEDSTLEILDPELVSVCMIETTVWDENNSRPLVDIVACHNGTEGLTYSVERRYVPGWAERSITYGVCAE